VKEIKVLDHGFIALKRSMGDDSAVVDAARVSYGQDELTGLEPDRDEKLIRYLLRHRHTSPFEHVTFTFVVQAPIFVLRQWHRHRTQCLGASTPLIFNRPCDGKVYRMALSDLVKKWNPPSAKRSRSERTVADFNRERLGGMLMRSPSGDVHLQDAWYSGEKPLYEVITKVGRVAASKDHVFKTPTGSSRLVDGLTEIMAMVQSGVPVVREHPSFTEQELFQEEWREFADGYEVSSLGRVRSYLNTRRVKQKIPHMRRLTANADKRLVVSIEGRVEQVSCLVCKAFIGDPEDQQVLHVNDNSFDNRVGNLYIGSPWDNAQDQHVNGGKKKLMEVPTKVLQVRKIGVQDSFDISVSGNHWFVADNLVVHNSYNEVSGRYAEFEDTFFIPAPETIGCQSTRNKQVRDMVEHPNAQKVVHLFETSLHESFQRYEELLSLNVPRELARAVLPLAMYSRMYATVNLHNLMHFIELRDHPHAQHEVRVYAQAALRLIEPIVPVSVKAFLELKKPSQE
jgi:thymidylate synthase (FAD)